MSRPLSRTLLAAAVLVSIAVATLFLAPPAAAQDTEAPAAAEAPGDLLASLDADGRFTTLAAALRTTGLDQTLATSGPYTLFAPTDDAFRALGEGTLEALSGEELAAILLTHVVSGTVTAADATTAVGTSVASLGGGALAVTATDAGLTVGGATVLEADVTVGDGTVHVVDAVLTAAPDASHDSDHDMSDSEASDDGDAL